LIKQIDGGYSYDLQYAPTRITAITADLDNDCDVGGATNGDS